jgi:AcrR family transcriptional regulator
MPRKPAPPPRKRRSAADARLAILDAAERRLAASGPTAIRLQEVAADVGVSHPTVLHHFGSREGLVEAVVARALDSLHTELLAALPSTTESADATEAMLDAVYEVLVVRGHGRTFLWLLLSGYAPTEDLRVKTLAEAVQAIRTAHHAAAGKPAPRFDDTYFTVLVPALTMLAMSVSVAATKKKEDERLSPPHFRRWLAKLIHEHLDA